ncbi:MAG: lysophospholipid acyltransferase family protein [Kofleriaceae bacterium]
MRALSALRHMGGGLFNALAELGSARMAPPRDMREAAHRLAGALGAVGRAHDLTVTTHGTIPRGTALIVANHVSYLDPLAIVPVCPALPIAKGEVSAWPIIGPIGAALGVTFVARDNPMARARVLHRVHNLLAQGVPVLNFPEGTTTAGDRVLPFHRATFGIAQRLGVPVVPVAVKYKDPATAWCNAATFLPHYLRTAGQHRVEVELTFGAPMSPRAGELPEDMAARARNIITRLLDANTRVRVSPTRSDSVLPAAAGF